MRFTFQAWALRAQRCRVPTKKTGGAARGWRGPAIRVMHTASAHSVRFAASGSGYIVKKGGSRKTQRAARHKLRYLFGTYLAPD